MIALDEVKYVAVLGEYKPRPIHNDVENARATRALEQLASQADLSPEKAAMVELLVTLIEKFEEERFALSAASPDEILRELMRANDLEQKDLAKLVGSKGIASEILAGKRRISRAHAQKFATRFNVPYYLFL